jgi:gliding motility-associated lipoprotein GldD
MNKNILGLTALLCSAFLLSCSSKPTYLPKPKGYNKMVIEPHAYQQLDDSHPFTFEYSKQALIKKDSSLIAEPHWIYVYYPKLQANIHLTYKALNGKKDLYNEHLGDSYKLAYKHDIKAYAIDEVVSKSPNGYTITAFELEGEVPSQFQFVATDSSKHFLRGALYFMTATKNDSLEPAIKYMKEDMMQLIKTLKFKD